ncbi:MAG: vanadium-dependent haloperoxidase [Lewinellaceae bacterium]|nr:vanadium-dependent haloperoxidase [Saprospiraceae bacterium]MCB9332023.1 vanadium-dependent haloperoxidase [Lewinellaceae bacterium]
MKKLITLLFVALLAISFGCDKSADAPFVRALTHKATKYEGRLAHEWMIMASDMIKENYLYGPQAARIYGYLGLTTWESVCFGLENGKSMAGQINDYPASVQVDLNREYDWGIVLCTAMKTVFPELIENINNAQRSQVDVLAALQEDEMMKKGITEIVRQDSRYLGAQIALQINDRIRKDGRELIRNIVPVIPNRDASHKWYWDPSTLGQVPVEPLWGTLRTFIIDNAQTCEPNPPFQYSENPGSDFYKDALEVYNIERTPSNKAIAYHWENGVGRTSSPAGHWVNITRQLLQQEDRNLAECAKAYCLVGFAAADGFSAAWFVKYKYFLLRPVTYIRENIDPTWVPLLNTPPYPDYSSGSSVMGGACPKVLISVFGDIPFTDRTHLGSPLYTPDGGPFVLPERSFTSLTQAGEDAMFSRVIGGVHFRRACEEGLESGRCIANTILSRTDFGF